MQANEFVKKFGIDHTKYLIEGSELIEFAIHSTCAGKYHMDTVSVDDLKRLVESWELVEFFGCLDDAIQIYEFSKDTKTILYAGRVIKIDQLKQAIADVESCQ